VIIAVDPQLAVPPYEQVRTQLVAAIESGQLPAEQRLPTVRQLAADLGLAVNTVARAYRELETAGRVQTRGRNGTFVTGAPSELRRQGQQQTAEFAARMLQLGLKPTEIEAMLRRELGLGA
jgi:DNA-binding transcriptional regulator YhcF (GntR family)